MARECHGQPTPTPTSTDMGDGFSQTCGKFLLLLLLLYTKNIIYNDKEGITLLSALKAHVNDGKEGIPPRHFKMGATTQRKGADPSLLH